MCIYSVLFGVAPPFRFRRHTQTVAVALTTAAIPPIVPPMAAAIITPGSLAAALSLWAGAVGLGLGVAVLEGAGDAVVDEGDIGVGVAVATAAASLGTTVEKKAVSEQP